MVEKISGGVILNTTHYLNIEGTENAFNKLGITLPSSLGDRKDYFAGKRGRYVLEIDRQGNRDNSKTQTQAALSTQMTAKTKAVLTLLETYTWKGKNIHKKVSVSFPHNCPVIFQTKILNDYVTNKTALLKFKGYYTWKRSPGGRFVIEDVPMTIINNIIQEKINADEAKAARREPSTKEQELGT